MLGRLALLAGLLALTPVMADGQGLEVFGGYSYMHVDANPGFSSNGWEFSGNFKPLPFAGVAADFDGHYGSGNSIHNFLFGPQVSWPARVSPFAHFLIGASHVDSGPFSDTSFAFALGGGIDAQLIPHVKWRVFQADFLHTDLFGFGQDNARISTGIVFHF